MNEFLKKAAENGEQTFKIVIVILKQLTDMENVPVVCPPVVDVLVNAFCATHICRKDQR